MDLNIHLEDFLIVYKNLFKAIETIVFFSILDKIFYKNCFILNKSFFLELRYIIIFFYIEYSIIDILVINLSSNNNIL